MRLFIPLFLFFALLTGVAGYGQSGSGWQWTTSSMSSTQTPGRGVLDIETDAAGNVYSTGFFEGNMTIGAYTIATTGDGTVNYNTDVDAFIAKYDGNGNILWLKRYGVAATAANEQGQVIKADADGNVYAGIGYGMPDVLKYDENGNLLWKKSLNLYEVGGINISPDGNLIVMTSNQAAKNIFKLNKADGSIMWQVSNINVGCNSGSTFQDFMDTQGNIYYTCFNASAVTATIAGQSYPTTGLTTFIVSLDNDGNRRWVQKMDNLQVQLSYTVDKNGKSYIQIGGGFGGTFQGITTASPLGNRYFELDNQGVVSRYAFQSPYKGLFRVKDDGIYGFTVETGGTARTAVYGDYYFAIPAASTKTLGIIIKYNASNDQIVWANSFEMTGLAYNAGRLATIETGPGSKVQVGGAYGNASAFGSFTNTPVIGGGANPTDFYLSQFDGANVAAPAVATWTGAAGNTSWTDAGNWNGGVPTAAMKAVIPAGAPFYPQGITAANLVAKLEIASGVQMGLPIGFAAPVGIVNMGTIEVTGTGTFYGFNTNASPVTGTGKLLFTANSPNSIYLPVVNNSLEFNKVGGSFSYYGGTIAGSLYLTNGTLSTLGELVLASPTATVTSSTTSFINYGKIKRAVTASGTYLFPVGSTSYAPVVLQLNGLSGPGFITVAYATGVNTTPNLTIGGSVVSSLLNAGIWTITPDVALTGGTYNVTLESRTSTNGVLDAARYVVLKREGASNNWAYEGKKAGAMQTGGTTSGSTVSNGVVNMVQENLNSFGEFATGIGSIAIANGTETNISRWTGGAGNGSWTDAANWDNGVPTSITRGIIPAGIGNYPQNIIAANSIGKLEIEAGVQIKLPNTFLAPGGIVNNGSIEITGGTYFKGFGNGSNGYAVLKGLGKLIFKQGGSLGISAQGESEAINQSIEIVNYPGFYTNNLFVNGNVTLTNSSISSFTMTDPNAVFSLTGDSYCTGNINRTVNASGSYSFPFVNGTATVVLNNVTGPRSLSVSSSLFTGSGTAPNLTVSGQTVTQLLNGGIFTVTPNVAMTAGSYTITINEKGATNQVTDAGRYVVVKRASSAAAWAYLGDNGTSSQVGNIVTATAGNLTSFSDFAIGIASAGVPVVLPVKLVSFTARAEGSGALLNWQTSAELNNNKFVIEKSKDAIAFTTIGEVKGKGTSNFVNNYTFKDNAAISGIVYYRLRQVDRDGGFEYSEIRTVNNITSAGTTIKVFPNPFVETINITGITVSTEFKLMTSSGQLILHGYVHNNQVRLPAGLFKGTYILQLKKENEVKPYLYLLQK